MLLPRGFTVHHEVELGVVIGKGGRDITAADAYKHVAGSVAFQAPKQPSPRWFYMVEVDR